MKHSRTSSPRYTSKTIRILDKDPGSSAPQAIHRILPIRVNDSGEQSVQFDIVMANEFIPESSVYQRLSGIYEMSDGTLDEFYRNGDALFRKRNGQITSAYTYRGKNEFHTAMGQDVRFELIGDGSVKACYLTDDGQCGLTGLKVFKY